VKFPENFDENAAEGIESSARIESEENAERRPPFAAMPRYQLNGKRLWETPSRVSRSIEIMKMLPNSGSTDRESR